MEKQKKISRWLKGLVIILGIMGLLFFGAVTWMAFWLKGEFPTDLTWSFVIFTWVTAAMCYGILIQFWKVCTQIGRDNSFSLENTAAFHRMAGLGAAIGIGYLVRLVYLCIVSVIRWQIVCYSICLMILGFMFAILCEALSQLIRNAYEVKKENELTI